MRNRRSERSAGSWDVVRGILGNRGGGVVRVDCRGGDEEPWNRELERDQRSERRGCGNGKQKRKRKLKKVNKRNTWKLLCCQDRLGNITHGMVSNN